MMKTTFVRANDLLEQWLDDLSRNPEIHDRIRLERLMSQVLPEQWQSRIISAGLHDGVWRLCVKNSSDAYQLRFLAAEIELRLGEKLPYPPKIKVKVDPGLWQKRITTSLPPAHLYQYHYNDEQADAVLKRLFREGCLHNTVPNPLT